MFESFPPLLGSHHVDAGYDRAVRCQVEQPIQVIVPDVEKVEAEQATGRYDDQHQNSY